MSFVNSLIHLKETYQSWVIIGWGILGVREPLKSFGCWKKSGLTPECNGLYSLAVCTEPEQQGLFDRIGKF